MPVQHIINSKLVNNQYSFQPKISKFIKFNVLTRLFSELGYISVFNYALHTHYFAYKFNLVQVINWKLQNTSHIKLKKIYRFRNEILLASRNYHKTNVQRRNKLNNRGTEQLCWRLVRLTPGTATCFFTSLRLIFLHKANKLNGFYEVLLKGILSRDV